MKDKIAFPLSSDVPLIGAPKPPTAFSAVDLVEEATLRPEGCTYFFKSAKSDKWGSIARDMNVLGATALKQVGALWGPLIGARVVFRLRKGDRAAFDLMTAASGQTAVAPPQALMLAKGEEWRVEVESPENPGALVRVALHTVVAD